MLDTVSAIIAVVDREGKLIYLNRVGRELSGYTEREISGRPGWETLAIPDDARTMCAWLRVALEGEPAHLGEFLWRASSGERRSIEWTGDAVRDSRGRLLGLTLTGRDITVDRSAGQFPQLTQASANQVGIGIVWMDCRGRFLYVNDAVCRLTGYSREELFARSLPDLALSFPAESLPGAWRILQRKRTWNSEQTIRSKNGELVPVQVSSNYVRRDEKQYCLSFVQDFRKRRRTEEALRKSEARFRHVFEHSHDALFLHDLDGNIVSVNNHAAQLLQVAHRDLVGRHLVTLHPAMDPVKVRELLQRIANGEAVRFETKLLCSGGDTIDVEVSATLIDREARLVLGSARDVTARKQAEAALRAAKERAEAASAAKNEFLAVMSHEIRTPLNGVIAMMDLLLEMPLDEQQKKCAELAVDSAGALLDIINDILDISKIEVGKLELEMKDFDLAATITSATETLAVQAREKGLSFHYSLDPDLPGALRGDAGRLRQVIVNLLANAVKFTRQGEVFLHARRVAEAGSRVTVGISVSDTGIGIPADRLESVFDAFCQVDASTTRKYGGTGLGLAISQRLVEAMGGQITVRSELGKSSTFSFTVELEKAGPRPSRARATREIPPTAPHPGRVLLVEDNLVNQQVALRILEHGGYRADIVPNGQEALRALETASYDLVLMDVQMPVMNGLEASRWIRDSHSPVRNHRVPIIALTAAAMKGDRERCLEAGMDDYISKPLRPHQLLALVEKWIPAETGRLNETGPTPGKP